MQYGSNPTSVNHYYIKKNKIYYVMGTNTVDITHEMKSGTMHINLRESNTNLEFGLFMFCFQVVFLICCEEKTHEIWGLIFFDFQIMF